MATTTVNYNSVTATTEIDWTSTDLAASATHIVGVRSDIIDNTTTKYLDFIVTGQMRVDDTITAGRTIRIYLYASTNVIATSTFNYPFHTTTEITETKGVTTFIAEQRDNLALASIITVSGTDNEIYSVKPFSVATIFGLPVAPLKWGLFVTHNMVGTLHPTEGDCFLHWTGIKLDSA